MYVHTYIYVHIPVCICIHACTYVCVYIHVYIHKASAQFRKTYESQIHEKPNHFTYQLGKMFKKIIDKICTKFRILKSPGKYREEVQKEWK